MRENLHPVVSGHPHWRAFEKEAGKLAAAEARHAGKRAGVDAERREPQRRLDEYEAEVERSILDGDEPQAEYPGEWVEPRSSAGTRPAAALFLQNREKLNQMTRGWAGRRSDDLDSVDEREAAVEAEDALRRLESALADGQLRGTAVWVKACAGVAQAVGPRPTLANYLENRRQMSFVSGVQPRGTASLPFSLDAVSVD